MVKGRRGTVTGWSGGGGTDALWCKGGVAWWCGGATVSGNIGTEECVKDEM